MPDVNVDQINNLADYTRGFNGSALDIIMLGGYGSGNAISKTNVLARGQNFDYTVQFPVTQADEINTTFVQETNHGRQELGSGTINLVFNLMANDQMPDFDSIRGADELTILEVTGDDHPMTTSTGITTILNAFVGVRIVSVGSAVAVGTQKMMQIGVVFRQKLPGKKWIQQNSGAYQYPAQVS